MKQHYAKKKFNIKFGENALQGNNFYIYQFFND